MVLRRLRHVQSRGRVGRYSSGCRIAVKSVLLYERIGLMNEYVLYYLEDRTHLALEKGTPAGREAGEDPGGG